MVGKSVSYATKISVGDEKDMDINGGSTTMFGSNGSGQESGGRSANALLKRAEQLQRWEESETNRENPNPVRGGVAVSWSKLADCRVKVTFPDECVFLAACASGDIDEVERLLESGADINTTNVDGMTALHQAVIDQNLDVVQYLVESGADINAQDNEGWTPLMAGASCEFMDIVRYLLDKGADPTLVNADGELSLDLTDLPQMSSLLEQEIARRGLDLEDAHNQEEQLMLRDALELLNSRGSARDKDKRHPRTGATALHVAAAKGYIKVMNILLQAGCNVGAVDFEGWTPLHAAAHWGEKQACEILVEHMADMDALSHAKQTCFDVADSDLCEALEEMKKKQEQMKNEHKSQHIEQQLSSRQQQEYKVRKNSITRISTDSKKTITKSDETKEAEALRTASSSETSDTEQEEKRVITDEKTRNTAVSSSAPSPTSPAAPAERKRQDAVQPSAAPPKVPKLDPKEKPLVSASTTVIPTSAGSPLASVSVTVVQPTRPRQTTAGTSSAVTATTKEDAPTSVNDLEAGKVPSPATPPTSRQTHGPPVIVPSEPPTPPWRLTGRRAIHPPTGTNNENGSPASTTVRTSSPQSPSGVVSVQVSSTTTPTPSKVTVVNTTPVSPASPASEGVRWRPGRLFERSILPEENERSCSKLPWVRARYQPSSASVQWSQLMKKTLVKPAPSNGTTSSVTSCIASTIPPGTPESGNKWTPPVSNNTGGQITPVDAPIPRREISDPVSTLPSRSFALPQRSEESEAERKVRAKRERESRRSTQGVTLETVKLAEQIHGSSGDARKAAAGASEGNNANVKSTQDGSPDQRQASKVPSSDGNDNQSPSKKPSMERPGTIGITGVSKSSSPASSPSAYRWRTTGHVATNTSESDTAKADALTPSTERSPAKLNSVSNPPLFLKRFQAQCGCSQEERNAQPAATDATSSSPSTATSSTIANAAAAAHIPNRKRLRNTRRSTGPVAQEDVHLAALENDQPQGQMTTEDEPGSAKETPIGGGGDQKPKTTSKMNSNATIISVGGVESASPVVERKSVCTADNSTEKQTVSQRTPNPRLKSDSTRPSSAGSAPTESSMDPDYRKLYEREKMENERLREKIKYLENLIESTRMIGAKIGSGDPSQSLSDRERKTLEKRIAQLEEETKGVEQLRSDNQRLKEENGALIRVISKLSK